MQHHPHTPPSPSGPTPLPPDCAPPAAPSPVSASRPARSWFVRRCRALTLVEVMVSMVILSTVLLGFISAFIQSRRVSEASVLHAACTSMVYGMIEQMKGFSYEDKLPNFAVDPDSPKSVQDAAQPSPPNPNPPIPSVRVRLDQDRIVWLETVFTPWDPTGKFPPRAPIALPASTAVAADVGAIDNYLGSIPLSTVTGTRSQEIALTVWLWIDEIPKGDATQVKKITMVYTYSYNEGSVTRIIRDMEVFISTDYTK